MCYIVCSRKYVWQFYSLILLTDKSVQYFVYNIRKIYIHILLHIIINKYNLYYLYISMFYFDLKCHWIVDPLKIALSENKTRRLRISSYTWHILSLIHVCGFISMHYMRHTGVNKNVPRSLRIEAKEQKGVRWVLKHERGKG